MGKLHAKVLDRVRGPAWDLLRPTFLDLSAKLLTVSPETVGVLTTIYVKYQVSAAPGAKVFAVVWLKSGKRMVIGLALPKDYKSPQLTEPPTSYLYAGLTHFFRIEAGQPVPEAAKEWANLAFHNVLANPG